MAAWLWAPLACPRWLCVTLPSLFPSPRAAEGRRACAPRASRGGKEGGSWGARAPPRGPRGPGGGSASQEGQPGGRAGASQGAGEERRPGREERRPGRGRAELRSAWSPGSRWCHIPGLGISLLSVIWVSASAGLIRPRVAVGGVGKPRSRGHARDPRAARVRREERAAGRRPPGGPSSGAETRPRCPPPVCGGGCLSSPERRERSPQGGCRRARTPMASLYQRFTGKINTSRSFPAPPEASRLLGGQGPEEDGAAPKPPGAQAPSAVPRERGGGGAGGRPRFQYQARSDCDDEDVRAPGWVGGGAGPGARRGRASRTPRAWGGPPASPPRRPKRLCLQRRRPGAGGPGEPRRGVCGRRRPHGAMVPRERIRSACASKLILIFFSALRLRNMKPQALHLPLESSHALLTSMLSLHPHAPASPVSSPPMLVRVVAVTFFGGGRRALVSEAQPPAPGLSTIPAYGSQVVPASHASLGRAALP